MSLNSPLFSVIPEETVRVAKAAFPKGNRYLLLQDTFGPLFHNPDFPHLFSHTGQPGEDPARLALITILQFAERLSDEQAADAVRSRIDGKYLLALPLTYAGFAPSVRSAFRTRLVTGNAEHLLFDRLLTQFREQVFSDSLNLHPHVITKDRLFRISRALAPYKPIGYTMAMRTNVSNPTAGARLLTVLAPNVTVLDVQIEPKAVLLTMAPSASTATCPHCSTETTRIHS